MLVWSGSICHDYDSDECTDDNSKKEDDTTINKERTDDNKNKQEDTTTTNATINLDQN